MTYRSNWIEIKGATENSANPDCLIDKFPEPHERYGPSDLQKWARAHALDIVYIDNCWLRVNVDAGQLRDFLQELYADDLQQIAEPLQKISDDCAYVIVAEEF